MTWTDILMALFSLSGILFGLALSYIAPEELIPGKKYLNLLRRILFAVILIIIAYFFLQAGRTGLMILFSAVLLAIFILDFRIKNKLFLGLHYLLFIAPYFVIAEEKFQLTLASIIFIYGLPAGTLLRTKEIKK